METPAKAWASPRFMGNCGISMAPLSIDRYPPPLAIMGGEPQNLFLTFEGYHAALARDPTALNDACQVGHTTLRAGPWTARPRGDAIGDRGHAARARINVSFATPSVVALSV